MIGRAWRDGDGAFHCWNSQQRTFERRQLVDRESFTTMMVLDLLCGVPGTEALTGEMARVLATRMRPDGLFHFFVDQGAIPADADCTATGAGLLLRCGLIERDLANAVLDRLLLNVDAENVVQTYLDPSPQRRDIVDPVVCVNVLHLAAMLGRLSCAAPTQAFVERVLRDRLYVFGTRYYPRPENFLWFLARLVTDFPEAMQALHGEVRIALEEQRGMSQLPMDQAQWLLASVRLGVVEDEAIARFLDLQQEDGSWPIDAFFRYGRSGIFFGTPVVTTAMAASLLRYLGATAVEEPQASARS
jgi:hypothetical protein